MTGRVSILNVGTGDTKLSFDPDNPQDRIRAARIVVDMIKRGYALLVDVGDGKYRRVEKFDEEKCEYIIADFDPVAAEEVDSEETSKRGHPRTRAIPAESTTAVGVPRRAGG